MKRVIKSNVEPYGKSKSTVRLLEMISDGIISAENVLQELLQYLPQNIVDEFASDYLDVDGDDIYSSQQIKASHGDSYFGESAYKKYSQLIKKNLAGKTISKRKDLGELPGGLVYEARQLNIDMWDLLEALEGMCYNGDAFEIDDSTYKIKQSLNHKI